MVWAWVLAAGTSPAGGNAVKGDRVPAVKGVPQSRRELGNLSYSAGYTYIVQVRINCHHRPPLERLQGTRCRIVDTSPAAAPMPLMWPPSLRPDTQGLVPYLDRQGLVDRQGSTVYHRG